MVDTGVYKLETALILYSEVEYSAFLLCNKIPLYSLALSFVFLVSSPDSTEGLSGVKRNKNVHAEEKLRLCGVDGPQIREHGMVKVVIANVLQWKFLIPLLQPFPNFISSAMKFLYLH